jgi:hypothetical protein
MSYLITGYHHLKDVKKQNADAAGNRTPMTLNVNSEEFNCEAPTTEEKRFQKKEIAFVSVNPASRRRHVLMPNPCSLKRVPPAKKHIPRT